MTLIYKNQMNPFADHRKAINERGFTLIELMVAIAILAILLGVGIPSFANIIIATRVKNAGIDLHTSLMAARSAAITRNTTVTITPQGGSWGAGWNITYVNTNPLLGAVGTLEVAKHDALPNVQITGGAATVVYNSVGRLSDTAPPVVPFSLTAANAQPNDGRCITLDLSGRPVTKKGVCP